MNLGNCSQCGKLYVVNSLGLCATCLKAVEDQYHRCADYLRKNRASTMQELSDATGVPVRLITRFIREGRIGTKDAPNLRFPCESCGEPIQDGNLCEACRNRLTRQLNQAQREADRREELKKAHDIGNTYIKDRDKFEKR